MKVERKLNKERKQKQKTKIKEMSRWVNEWKQI